MITKRFILLSTACLVLAALILMVGTAMATGPTPGGNLCGETIREDGSNGLILKKDVFCGLSRIWNWDISKSADQSSLTLSAGQQAVVNYTVTASALATNSYSVAGKIGFRNSSSVPITIVSIEDSLGPVDCAISLPYVLPAGNTVECSYSATINSAAAENVVTVTDSNGVAVSAVVPIDWSKAAVSETDECAVVTDTFAGTLGTVCAGQQTTFSFNYSRNVKFDVCGEYTVENTASFTTNDSGATGSSSWTVDVNVPCAGGCTLTPGYWKTHSSFGPAPYDDTWAQVGENSTFFLSGKSYYGVLWTAPSGNAYFILAHAYIAAKLNVLNGASIPSGVQLAYDTATTLFNTYTPAQIGALRGSSSLRAQFVSLANTLDNYNNGLLGPGHCSE